MDSSQPQSLLPVPSGNLQIPEQPELSQLSGAAIETLSPRPIRFSLVIPTYNESKNIEAIVDKLSYLLDQALPDSYELIVVDDNSPDRTWEIAHNLTTQYPQLRVMRRVEERGLSTAVIRGWQVARGEVLGVIDADLQHPPELLLQLWGEILRGGDMAIASRHVEGGGVSDWSFTRRILSRGAQTLGLIILPEVIGRVTDPMSGYFMVRRKCLAGRTLNPLGYKILIEVIARGRVPWIGEVGYVFQERQEGESKVTWKQYVEYIRHLLRLRFSMGPVGRLLRFGVVGLSGVFVDMAVLYLLSDVVGWRMTRSKILASELAIINNFLWNDRWTFGDVAKQQPSKRQRLKRLIKFNIICLAGLVLNVLLLNIIYNFVVPNKYAANLMAIALVTIWNFWLNMKLSWRVTDVKEK